MKYGLALLLGLLAWAIAFAVAVAIFPLREAGEPIFDTIMGVTVTASAAIAGVLYIKRVPDCSARQLLYAGCIWLAVCFLIDLFLFSWGPMAMPFLAYVGDVGLIYLIMPIVAGAMGFALERGWR